MGKHQLVLILILCRLSFSFYSDYDPHEVDSFYSNLKFNYRLTDI